MDADEACRIAHRRGDPFQRNTGRVGGEDRAGPGLRLERGEERALGVEVLEDRFDDHVGAGHAVARHVGDQPVGGIAHAARVLQALAEELGGATHGRRDQLQIIIKLIQVIW